MMHGDHGMSDKWYAFEQSIKVPLVIKDPRMSRRQHGAHNDDFTLSVDLAPTILSAANIPVPSVMQGRDISDLYLRMPKADWRGTTKLRKNGTAISGVKPWRQDFFYEWNQGRREDAVGHKMAKHHIPAVFALVEKQFKYIYWPQFRYEQLYNYVNDVHEEFDIFNSTVQSSEGDLIALKRRYDYLKERAQNGFHV
jgi:arylsulfatase